jgi:hypothetical protein
MKGRLVKLAGVVCIVGLIVSGAHARGRPDKPGGSKPEWIEFTGKLDGRQIVEGCCPNAGPFPEYTLTLGGDWGDLPAGTYDGYLFINRYGVGRNRKYVVQFWNEDESVAIEIIGGVINHDRQGKVLTVTFSNEVCWHLETKMPIAVVSFVLVRSPA